MSRLTAAEFRDHTRMAALTVARGQLETIGWDRVTMSGLAAELGVSRPSLYAAFGNKDELAQALVLAEAQDFLTGAANVLRSHPNEPLLGISEAVAYTLARGEESLILRAILTSGVSGDSENAGLLKLMTIRADTILPLVIAGIQEWLAQVCPAHDPQDLQLVADTLVRLVISHLMSPATNPATTPADFARIATGLLPELSQVGGK